VNDLEFEKGSLHRTRGGDFAIVRDSDDIYELKGLIFQFGKWDMCSWELDGSYYEDKEHKNDLVEILDSNEFFKKGKRYE